MSISSNEYDDDDIARKLTINCHVMKKNEHYRKFTLSIFGWWLEYKTIKFYRELRWNENGISWNEKSQYGKVYKWQNQNQNQKKNMQFMLYISAKRANNQTKWKHVYRNEKELHKNHVP